MTKNEIERPQADVKNANMNSKDIKQQSHAGRNHGNTKEEK